MSRPVYVTLEQIRAVLPNEHIVEALDDDKDGLIDSAVWDEVARHVSNMVDGRVGMRYVTPFDPANLPAIVADAAVTLACSTLYIRRGFGTAETNPFLPQTNEYLKTLTQIGNGQMPLTPDRGKPTPSVAVFTEPARTSSSSGLLSH